MLQGALPSQALEVAHISSKSVRKERDFALVAETVFRPPRISLLRGDADVINPLKTKRICFIQGLSAYRAVNTLHFGYKNQSLNVL
jgi:hypothetical protein